MIFVRRRLAAMAALLAMLTLVVGGAGYAAAQDGTPVAAPPTSSAGIPAHIDAGACPDVGEVVFPLADVVGAMGMDMAMATPMAGGSTAAIPAMMSVTTVDADLATILSAEHAINLHESAEAIDVYIACGDIGGMPDAGNNLVIGLAEQNDSGYSGVAWLHGNDDATTTVTIFLAQGLSGGAMGDMDMATPAA